MDWNLIKVHLFLSINLHARPLCQFPVVCTGWCPPCPQGQIFNNATLCTCKLQGILNFLTDSSSSSSKQGQCSESRECHPCYPHCCWNIKLNLEPKLAALVNTTVGLAALACSC